MGNLCLNPSTCEVSCDRQVVPLTPKEYSLLELFLRNPLRVYSRSAILDHLWSFETVPGEETVTSHIRGLRQKLKLAGVYSDPIETVYGMGYRLKPEPQHNKESTLSKVVKLAEEVAPEPKAQATIEQQAMAEVSAVWERRKEKLSQRATVIEQAIAALLRAPLDNELRQQAQQEAHKLAGSLGMFNLDEGSRLAREIEYLIQLDSPLTQAQMLHLNELAAALSQQLQQAANQFAVAKEWERSSPALLSSNLSIAKILAVDDDPQVLVALRYLLQPWGMQLSSLNNPLRFWETISLVSPDLLILDVEMPQSSGLDLCQSLRNDPRWSSLPVLVLTAHTNAETMRQVFAVGADDFISKPIVGPGVGCSYFKPPWRSRLYQNKTQIDPLTGVANYRASAPECCRS